MLASQYIGGNGIKLPYSLYENKSKAVDYNEIMQVIKSEIFKESEEAKDKLNISPIANEKSKIESKEAKTESTDEKKDDGTLSDEEQKVVDELKSRDAEVRAHEQAHISAGGGLVSGGATYSYQSGPDGKKYAIGGEVQIDISPVVGNHQATISKMQQVRRAALAPADPLGQDRAVASAATAMELQARQELNQENAEKLSTSTKTNDVKTQLAVNAYKQSNQLGIGYQNTALKSQQSMMVNRVA